MTQAAEAAGQQSQLESTLDAGIDALSKLQSVRFRLYNKVVLDQDGTVFWAGTPQFMTVKGSFHYATDRFQDEDQTIGANQVIFTAEQEVTQFNVVSPLTMWIGTWPIPDSPPLRVAFGARSNYYVQENAWHYSGYAVYPAMETQIVDNPTDIDPDLLVVSNSLPIWLSLNSFAPVVPSFLVPDNLAPPYIVAHIEPSQTNVLQNFPIGVWPGSPPFSGSALVQLTSSQLARDDVTLTFYGFSNQQAIQYYWMLIDYSLNIKGFGFANSPAIRDEKRTQREIATIAQKKTLHIEANYYQGTADATASRLILEAEVASYTIVPA